MKIDKECIDHNVTRLIEEKTQCIGVEGKDGDHVRSMTLGYIKGVLELGEVLKEVLKHETDTNNP